MPAHYPQIKEKEIWDLVNFVLALPYQLELLTDVNSAAAPTIASMAGQP
jgi:hypothetical protein